MSLIDPNSFNKKLFEPRDKKTCLRGFPPDAKVAKTKALISFAVTAKLICVFVFAYAKSRFSHNEAHLFNYR